MASRQSHWARSVLLSTSPRMGCICIPASCQRLLNRGLRFSSAYLQLALKNLECIVGYGSRPAGLDQTIPVLHTWIAPVCSPRFSSNRWVNLCATISALLPPRLAHASHPFSHSPTTA